MTEGRLRPAENGPESKGQGGGGRQYNGGPTVPPVYCRACLMGGGGKGTQEALQGPRGIRARPGEEAAEDDLRRGPSDNSSFQAITSN